VSVCDDEIELATWPEGLNEFNVAIVRSQRPDYTGLPLWSQWVKVLKNAFTAVNGHLIFVLSDHVQYGLASVGAHALISRAAIV